MGVIYIGIDYSINKYGICATDENGKILASLNPIKVEYSKNKIKYAKIINRELNLKSFELEITEEIELGQLNRLEHLYLKSEVMSDIAISFINKCIQMSSNIVVFIEGYSNGSRNRFDDIREVTGLLKTKLIKNNVLFTTIAPTSLKKCHTGFGHCHDEAMFQSSIELLGKRLPNDDLNDAFALSVSCREYMSSKKPKKKKAKKLDDSEIIKKPSKKEHIRKNLIISK